MDISSILADLDSSEKTPCYPARLQALSTRGLDTTNIETGMSEVVQTIEKGKRSFVIYGEPQSGKTEFMIALACKLIDLDFHTIFVVMNDNTELETQNFDRFHSASELNPTPMRDFHVNELSNDELKTRKPRIIFCRKNSKNLQKLITSCRHMNQRIVIDDEADYATPNTKINQEDVTAINKHLSILGDLGEAGEGVYIGVTATPGRLDLNNTFLNRSEDWVFLKSHDNYKGRSFFFPATPDDSSTSNYQLVKLPDAGDDPKYLRHAVFRFLCRTALLNLPEGADKTAYSMLIHTAGKVNDHEKDQKDIQGILGVLSDRSHRKFRAYVEELARAAELVLSQHNDAFSVKELVLFILNNIGRSEVLVINHKNDSANVRRACQPKSLFTFAVGGNIVSRGLTFERLLTFFFSRNVKGRLQQNTYIQRARMFGNRPYSQYFELCVPQTLFNDWADCFQDHELSLRMARAKVYQHVQGIRNSVADRGAIDLRNITMEKSERTVGEIFKLTDEIKNRLIGCQEDSALETLQSLLNDGLIKDEHLNPSLMSYLIEMVERSSHRVLMVLRRDGENKLLQNIERYQSDGIPESITRKRGGIIHAMLNKRPEYERHQHFILPIRNNNGQARFIYKSNTGHTILENIRTNRAVQ